MTKVCYFTSKNKNDIRVFHKECVSLVKNGYDVTIVCPNSDDTIAEGVKIVGVNYPYTSNFHRFTKLPSILFKKALEINADIYHFNDPASIYYGVKLKALGKKVIFDAFEDHPSMWMNRASGLKGIIYKLIGYIYKKYELHQCSKFDAVLVCYDWTKDRISKVNKNVELVLNFPIVDVSNVKYRPVRISKHVNICYAGTIADSWNIPTVIKAIENVDNVTFNLAGWSENDLMARIKNLNGWNKVRFFGKLNKEDVYEKVYDNSDIGIALYNYSPLCNGKVGNMSNNKLFEYLLMGMPVICTDFDLWKNVIEANNCGVCVNPSDCEAITNAIKYIQKYPEEAHEMGRNGQKAILEKYNWATQEAILLDVYKRIK